MKEEPGNSYSGIVIFLLALLNVVIHLSVSDNLEYHRDELLYFSLGLHPAAGYATVPPMIGWIAGIMQGIFGTSVFAVRIFPAVMSGVMVYLVAAIAREMGGSGYARILAATGFVVSIIGLRSFLFFQPVHIDIFFWTLIFYLVIRYVNTSSDKYLLLIGITAGAGLLNKYLLGLLILMLLIIVPLTRYRTIFTRRKFWIGLLAGFIVFLPNLIWQLVNGLPVLSHLVELERTQLVNVDRTAFIIEQLIIPGMASVLTIAGIIHLFTGRKAWQYRFLGIVTLAVILSLMMMRGKNYYTMGVFPFLMAAGAVSWEMTLKKTWSRLTLILLLVLLTIPSLPIGIPVFGPEKLAGYFKVLVRDYKMDFICRFEDGSIRSLPQDYADMLGWEEMTGLAAEAWNMIEDKNSAFIFCENYGYAGAVTIIGKKYGLPEAVSFQESFRYWIPLVFNPDITSAVYINDEVGEDVGQIFGKITRVGSISNPLSREWGTSVWLLEEPLGSFNSFWLDNVKQFF
jgi:hypothetical protein